MSNDPVLDIFWWVKAVLIVAFVICWLARTDLGARVLVGAGRMIGLVVAFTMMGIGAALIGSSYGVAGVIALLLFAVLWELSDMNRRAEHRREHPDRSVDA